MYYGVYCPLRKTQIANKKQNLLTIISILSLLTLLLVTKDEVNPFMKVIGHVVTLKSLATLAAKVSFVCVGRKKKDS